MKTALDRTLGQLRQIAGQGAGPVQTDRQLLDRFLAQGEEIAFAELVRRHGPMVLAVCRRVLHHQQDAEDAFQAAFLVLARKAAAVRHQESLAGWLFQVAHRLALRARARDQRPKEPLSAMHQPLAASDDPSSRRETQALVDEALDQLPDHYRSAIVLCCLEGKSQSEVARQLGTTPDAINSRIKRAKLLLRAHLQRRGVALSALALASTLAAGQATAASFPLDLMARTTQAAVGFAAGNTPNGIATPSAIALARGALRTMWTNPLKLLTGLLLAVGLLCAAAWLPGFVMGDDPSPSAAAQVVAALPAPVAVQPAGGKEKPAKMHCIILWMSGGPSQIDTFDLKPGHANGGPFRPIDTTVKGMQICEHLPLLAKRAEHLAIIRSLTHTEGDHGRGTFLMHTGYNNDNMTNFPSLGCILGKELGDDNIAVPRFVMIGSNMFPAVEIGSGYLGEKYAPLDLGPADGGFKQTIEDIEVRVPPLPAFEALDKKNAEAMRKAVLTAYDTGKEKKAVHDAYGNTAFGKNCLLARRLIEQGVPVVEINMTGWDTHGENFGTVKKQCKTLDPAWSALLDDLKERKLLDRTLIVWMGEFGRTPIININQGRDHYPKVSSVVLAGAKIKGGRVIGTTSNDGVNITNQPVSVGELFATIYTAVGVDPAKEYKANTGQPIRLTPAGTKAVAELLK